MSLNWDGRKIRAVEQLHNDDPKRPNAIGVGWLITDSLVWASLFTGMDRITEENWQQVYIRTRAAHAVLGMCVYRKLKDDTYVEQALTPGMVRRRIGLETNVSPKTDAQFKRWLGETAFNQAKDGARLLGIKAA